MKTAQTKVIGETSYTVNQLGPTLALDLLHDLVRVLGPALAPIVSNVGELGRLLDKDVDNMKLDFLGDAVKAITSNVDKATTKHVIDVLAKVTVIEGKGRLSQCYEAHFADAGLAELFQWLGFALTTQYDDFLHVFGNAIKLVPRPAVKTA